MRLTLDRDLFAPASPAEALALVSLLSTVAHDPTSCILLINPPYWHGGDNGPLDDWLDSRGQHESKALRSLFSDGLQCNAGTLTTGARDSHNPRRWNLHGSLSIRVERREHSDWKNRVLTVPDAIDLLREPLHLVLENDRTDLEFLCFLAGSEEGEHLRSLVDRPGRINLHSGGGGASKKRIEELRDKPLTPGNWRRLLRTWILFDRDAGDSNALEMSRSAAAMMAVCEEVDSIYGEGLSWVCLRRRDIESYAPDQALREEKLAQHNDFVERVISWRSDPARTEWAWALSIKEGLSKDIRPEVPKDDRTAIKERTKELEARLLKAPFDQLPAADVGTLAHGLGERVGKVLRERTKRGWSSEIPKEYDRGPADQAPRHELVRSLLDRM